MEQNQNLNKREEKEKRPLSPQEMQKRRKLIIFPLMGIAFAGCMWLIFAPSPNNKLKKNEISGFNADIPLTQKDGIIKDKKTAYEQEQMQNKQNERMRSLQDFGFILGD